MRILLLLLFYSPLFLAKPIFPASVYGRELECIRGYEAQGDHQLTLHSGDRVKLIKSGTRGWVLGRTHEGK